MQETQETWVQSLAQEDPLEKEMAMVVGKDNPLQYLIWKTPWTEGSSGLQSTGSQKSQTQLSTHVQVFVTLHI